VEYDQIIHNTSALDDAMKAARDRDRLVAQSILNRARATLVSASIPLALIASVAFVGAACAAAWIMRPHFDFHTVAIDVPKLVEKQVDAPKIVERMVEVPRLVEIPVEVPKLMEKPVGFPSGSQALPPKTPDTAERHFINRPDYVSADYHGRLVPPDENEVKFEDGNKFVPTYDVNGVPQLGSSGEFIIDHSQKFDVDRYIGDYAYCNKAQEHPILVKCWVIHNDIVQPILKAPYSAPKL
jgi:hypothetical protein